MTDDRILGLKVDVDTRRGMEQGVPALLSAMADLGVVGTFFLSFGPDNSGKAIRHLLANPRFLLKMLRTNAPGLYGMRTALYGTILKPPMIAMAFPHLCRTIEESGHEVELHAWDHRGWQDLLPRKKVRWVSDWLHRGVEAYEDCLRHPPKAFGAPGWVLTDAAVSAISARTWTYVSCTRAPAPFLLSPTRLMEIPSDLPCLEEIGGRRGLDNILMGLSRGGIHVLPVHAEVEGGALMDAFRDIVRGARREGFQIVPLGTVAEIHRASALPERPFRMARLPGRAFPCAV